MGAGEFVKVEVANTGKWIPRDAEEEKGKGGIGLENIRTRLSLTYGDRCDLKIGEGNGRVLVTVEIPRRGDNNEERL
jgi:LytS/YehU family sensor histidine kinase